MQCVGHGRGRQHYRARSEQCAVLGWPFQGRSNTGGVPLDGNTHACGAYTHPPLVAGVRVRGAGDPREAPTTGVLAGDH